MGEVTYFFLLSCILLMTIVQLRLKSLREISEHPSNLNIKPREESSCVLLIVLDE